MTCPAVAQYGDHLYTTTYHRPWRRMFRKQLQMRCWRCHLLINEP